MTRTLISVRPTFASDRSFSTRVAHVFDHFASFARLPGSSTCRICRRGAGSTPRSAGAICIDRLLLGLHDVWQDAQRGSFRRRSVVTTAGIFKLTVCKPPSTSRVTKTSSACRSTFEAKVPCDQPAAPTAFDRSGCSRRRSLALPTMTRPGSSFSTSAFSIFATASGSVASSCRTKMPRSAPIARAVRMVSWHSSGRPRRQ